MRLRTPILFTAALAAFLICAPAALAQARVTAGAGGIFPAGTTFSGVPINGLQSGYGVEIASDGSALGQFCSVLLGVSLAGAPQNIVIEGKVRSGSRTAANVATFSGTCSINMGDGTLPVTGVPFTATITTDTNDQGSIALLLGQTALPAATVSQGSITVE